MKMQKRLKSNFKGQGSRDGVFLAAAGMENVIVVGFDAAVLRIGGCFSFADKTSDFADISQISLILSFFRRYC